MPLDMGYIVDVEENSEDWLNAAGSGEISAR